MRARYPVKTSLATGAEIEESDLFYSFLTREYINLRNSNVPPAETLAILKTNSVQSLNMVSTAATAWPIRRATAIGLKSG